MHNSFSWVTSPASCQPSNICDWCILLVSSEPCPLKQKSMFTFYIEISSLVIEFLACWCVWGCLWYVPIISGLVVIVMYRLVPKDSYNVNLSIWDFLLCLCAVHVISELRLIVKRDLTLTDNIISLIISFYLHDTSK